MESTNTLKFNKYTKSSRELNVKIFYYKPDVKLVTPNLVKLYHDNFNTTFLFNTTELDLMIYVDGGVTNNNTNSNTFAGELVAPGANLEFYFNPLGTSNRGSGKLTFINNFVKEGVLVTYITKVTLDKNKAPDNGSISFNFKYTKVNFKKDINVIFNIKYTDKSWSINVPDFIECGLQKKA